jgi:putative transposase
MARSLRVEFEGACYHVTAHGNGGQAIFADDRDRTCFLEALGEACQRHGLVVHGYCLMSDHYDLLAQTPRGNLSQAIGWVQVTYTVRFNRRHGRSGHLVQGRFKAHLLDADEYARPLLRYVHLGPVRPQGPGKAVPGARRKLFEGYPWSSHQAYAGTAAQVPEWLSQEWLWHWLEASQGRTLPAARRQYRRDMDSAFGKPIASPLDELRGGLVLGGERLWKKAQALLAQSSRRDPGMLRWRKQRGLEQARARLAKLSAREDDPKVRLWMRVTLCGERMSDLGRELGYSDGSGVLQVVKRLEARAKQDKVLAGKLAQLRRAAAE